MNNISFFTNFSCHADLKPKAKDKKGISSMKLAENPRSKKKAKGIEHSKNDINVGKAANAGVCKSMKIFYDLCNVDEDF